jgi:hypothetical protein
MITSPSSRHAFLMNAGICEIGSFSGDRLVKLIVRQQLRKPGDVAREVEPILVISLLVNAKPEEGLLHFHLLGLRHSGAASGGSPCEQRERPERFRGRRPGASAS